MPMSCIAYQGNTPVLRVGCRSCDLVSSPSRMCLGSPAGESHHRRHPSAKLDKACARMRSSYDGYMKRVLTGDQLTKWSTGPSSCSGAQANTGELARPRPQHRQRDPDIRDAARTLGPDQTTPIHLVRDVPVFLHIALCLLSFSTFMQLHVWREQRTEVLPPVHRLLCSTRQSVPS